MPSEIFSLNGMSLIIYGTPFLNMFILAEVSSIFTIAVLTLESTCSAAFSALIRLNGAGSMITGFIPVRSTILTNVSSVFLFTATNTTSMLLGVSLLGMT